MATFRFRPMAAGDLPRMREWLERPHVRAAFGEPREWLDEIAANFESDWIEHFVAELEGAPAGFAQHYDTQRAPPGEWSSQPPGTRGLDFFLGEPRLLGRGIGIVLLAQFADFVEHTTGARRLIVDPDPTNTASLRCAERCGFALDASSGLWARDAG